MIDASAYHFYHYLCNSVLTKQRHVAETYESDESEG